MTMNATPVEIEPEAVHGWFGLSYSNYLTLPRTLLQSMPDEWQHRFVACLNELQAAFAHVPQAAGYKVEPAVEREVCDLTDDELKKIGYTKNDPCRCFAFVDDASSEVARIPAECDHEVIYYNDHDTEVPSWHRVMWPTGRDPVPHYSRGRTYIAPASSEANADGS
jgi:hypothetical protein